MVRKVERPRARGEQGRTGSEKAGGGVRDEPEPDPATPLVDATIQFMKEFVPDPPMPGAESSRSKGKEREEDAFEELDSFIPTYVYDAMKEKKRFASMIVSVCSPGYVRIAD